MPGTSSSYSGFGSMAKVRGPDRVLEPGKVDQEVFLWRTPSSQMLRALVDRLPSLSLCEDVRAANERKLLTARDVRVDSY